MNYTFHQLQIFVKVCESASVTRASEELFLTQPAVSIQLKKFQEQFDIPLVEHVGRKIFITDFGKEICKVCLEILEKSEEIKYTSQQYSGLLAGKLTISIVSTGKYIMPYFLSGFMKKYPGVEILVDVTNKEKVLDSFLKNEVEFALVSTLPEELIVHSEDLMSNQLYLVGSPEDKGKKVTKKEMNKMSFVFREKGSATRNAMEKYFDEMGVKVSSKLKLVSNEGVKQAVCAGLGYSILPIIGMRGELQLNRLSVIEAPGLPIETTWQLIYSKSKPISPVGSAFLEHIQQNKEAVLQTYFSEGTQ